MHRWDSRLSYVVYTGEKSWVGRSWPQLSRETYAGIKPRQSEMIASDVPGYIGGIHFFRTSYTRGRNDMGWTLLAMNELGRTTCRNETTTIGKTPGDVPGYIRGIHFFVRRIHRAEITGWTFLATTRENQTRGIKQRQSERHPAMCRDTSPSNR